MYNDLNKVPQIECIKKTFIMTMRGWVAKEVMIEFMRGSHMMITYTRRDSQHSLRKWDEGGCDSDMRVGFFF